MLKYSLLLLPSAALLADEGADIGLKNEQGLTALDFAKRAQWADAVAFLSKLMEVRRPKGAW